MIDNFAPQPYPLECSDAAGIWRLVIGWVGGGAVHVPVVVATDGTITSPIAMSGALRWRLAEPPGTTVRVASPSPRPVAAPARSTTSSA